MVFPTALRCGRSRTAVRIKPLGRRATSVFRYRSARPTELSGKRTLRLALRQRRHGRHGWAGCTSGDRRLGFLIATAEADIGQALSLIHI